MNRLAQASRSVALLTWLLTSACSDSPSEPDGDSLDTDTVRVTGAEPALLPLDTTFTLRVFGSGFEPDSRVVLTVDGQPTPKVRTNATLFVSPQELDASITTAADAPGGPYDIVVGGPDGKQGVGTELVDIVIVPMIVAIQPSPAAPLDTVTIIGWNFGSERGQTWVTFDGRPSTVLEAQNRAVVAVVPPEIRCGTIEVELTVTAGTARAALGIAAWIGIRPSIARPGDEVVIVGACFNLGPWPEVTINGRPALVKSYTDSDIVVVVPVLTEPGTAEVRLVFGSSLYGVTYLGVVEHLRPDPSISTVYPYGARRGSDIVIVGSNFTSNPGLVSVKFCPYNIYDGYPYFQKDLASCPEGQEQSVSDTRMTVTVPPSLRVRSTYGWVVVVTVRGAQHYAWADIGILSD